MSGGTVFPPAELQKAEAREVAWAGEIQLPLVVAEQSGGFIVLLRDVEVGAAVVESGDVDMLAAADEPVIVAPEKIVTRLPPIV